MVLTTFSRAATAALGSAVILAACGGAAGNDGPRVRDDAQTITWGAVPALEAGGKGALTAQASSGLAVGFSSLTPTVCAIDGSSGQIQALGAGDCTIAANQGGNDRFAPASQVTTTLKIAGRQQTLTFATPPAPVVGELATVSASSTSGLPVRYASLTPGLCSVDAASGRVTALASGACLIVADQPGDGQWAAAPQVTSTVPIAGMAQSITLAPLPPLKVGQGTQSRATASSGLAVEWSSATPDICSVTAAGAVQALASGPCIVVADQPGDARWRAAAQAQQVTSVTRLTQIISFSGPVPSLTVGSPATATATASSGLPVRYATPTPATCGVDAASGRIAPLSSGECTLQATQAGDAVWEPAPAAALTLRVAGMPQTIGFAAAPAVNVNGTGTVRAASTSGMPVSYRSTTPQTCDVSGTGVVTGIQIGNCEIAASQPGNGSWAAAPTVTQSLAVTGMAQTISFGPAPSLEVGGTATVRASASSGLAVSYSSLTPAVCTVNATSGLVKRLAGGACSIAAGQPGSTIWAAAPQVVQTLDAGVAVQSLSFAPASDVVVNGTTTVRAIATSGLPATYVSLSTAICSVASSTGIVTGLMAGTCTIGAEQAGNAAWAAAAQVSLALNVRGMSQSLTWTPAPALSAGGSATMLAKASSGLPPVYRSQTPTVCSVNSTSGLVSAIGTGDCRVVADQPGNSYWAAAPQVVQSVTVNAAAQSISFGAAPALRVGTTATVRAVATSGLPVTYASQSVSCSVDAGSGLVTGLAAGNCTVAAAQPGNAIWAAAATVTQALNVAPDPNQTISFGRTPVLTLGGSATVSATATSGLPVVLASQTPGVCGINPADGLVWAYTLGDCVISANQGGNSSYNPAPQVTLRLSVQIPPGMSVPGAPAGVSASLGSSIGQVLVTASSINSGASPVTLYTVTSRPAGITAQSGSLPVTVNCPSSCAGYAFTLQASNALGAGSASTAVDVLTTFDVLTRFYEPDTQPRDSIFTGSFVLNTTTQAITGLTGRLTESMSGNAIGSAPYYDMTQVPLAFQLQSWRDASLGGTFVASFAKNTTSTFTTASGGDGWSPQAGIASGGVYAGFPAKYATTIQNSSILIFVPDNPFVALTAAQIAKLAYADCAPGGMMGAVCMTATSSVGYGAVGTMSGYPVSQTITRR